jgi:Domain of unknown function (DUF4395)
VSAAPEPPSILDARRARFRELVIAITIFGGWVFDSPWVIPMMGACLVLGAAAGQRWNPILRIWDDVIAPRLRQPMTETDPALFLRFVDTFEGGVLVTATVLLASGMTWAAWLLALVVAVWATIWAATGISLPRRFHDQYGPGAKVRARERSARSGGRRTREPRAPKRPPKPDA